MKCLDTYVLAEIAEGNKNFFSYLTEEFVITELTLVEFYWVLLRDANMETADQWYAKLKPYTVAIPVDLMIAAMRFRRQHKSKNFSFFDCAGYIFSIENNILFVTGDKEFEHFKGIEFRK